MKSNNKIILLLVIITAAAVCGMIWAIFFRDTDTNTVLTPDRVPSEAEVNAESIEDDSFDKAETSDGGGAVSLSYSTKVTISLSDEKAELYFVNPGRSTHDMVLQVIIQNTAVIQSGKLAPGNQVTKLDLLENAKKSLTEGVYNGKFRILFYNPESGEVATVNTEIPVEITVTE